MMDAASRAGDRDHCACMHVVPTEAFIQEFEMIVQAVREGKHATGKQTCKHGSYYAFSVYIYDLHLQLQGVIN